MVLGSIGPPRGLGLALARAHVGGPAPPKSFPYSMQSNGLLLSLHCNAMHSGLTKGGLGPILISTNLITSMLYVI